MNNEDYLMIYLDFDSTLNNLAHEWVKYINTRYQANITVQHIKHWDWIEETFGKEANDFWKNPDIYSNIKPLEGAIDFVTELREQYNVSIITHSWPGTEEAKDDNIKRFFGDINVIHESEKHKVTRDGILIDDNPHTIVKHCESNYQYGIVFTNNNLNSWSSIEIIKDDINNVSKYIRFKRNYTEILDFLKR
ncbi:MAG: hypothetical protein WC055_00540 [Melioribacteraceae bacterium]